MSRWILTLAPAILLWFTPGLPRADEPVKKQTDRIFLAIHLKAEDLPAVLKALHSVPAVESATVDHEAGSASVLVATGTNPASLVAALRTGGFESQVAMAATFRVDGMKKTRSGAT